MPGKVPRLVRNYQGSARNISHAYLVMTKLFAQQIPLTKFNDPDWVLELDVLFAHEYIKALNDYDLGVIEENGWKLVLKRSWPKKLPF
jgi:hypothetical protein